MSVFYEVLKAVKDRVQTATGAPVPKIRKAPIRLKEDTEDQLILVCPGGPERVGLEAFPNVVSYEYPVLVAIIEGFDRQWELDVASMLELREAVRNVLYRPTLTTTNGNVFDTGIEPLDPFSLTDQKAVHETTGFRLVYKSVETRVA